MLEKVLGKVEISGEIGEKVDEQYEQAKREAHQKEGAKLAFLVAGKALSGLHTHIDKDVEEENLPMSFETQLEASAFLKKWINRGIEIMLNLKEKTQSEVLVANGKAAALRETIEVVQRYHNTAITRRDQLMAPDEETEENETNGRKSRRKPGEHPGASPLDKRRAKGRKRGLKLTVEKSNGQSGSPKPAAKSIAQKKPAKKKTPLLKKAKKAK